MSGTNVAAVNSSVKRKAEEVSQLLPSDLASRAPKKKGTIQADFELTKQLPQEQPQHSFPRRYQDLFYRKRNVGLAVEGNVVFWKFAYDAMIVEAIKECLPSRHFNPQLKRWTCPLECLPTAIALYEHMGRQASPALKERARQMTRKQQAAQGNSVTCSDPKDTVHLLIELNNIMDETAKPPPDNAPIPLGLVIVKFLYNPELVSAVRNVAPAHRFFDVEKKQWRLDLLALPMLLQQLEPLGYAVNNNLGELSAACQRVAQGLFSSGHLKNNEAVTPGQPVAPQQPEEQNVGPVQLKQPPFSSATKTTPSQPVPSRTLLGTCAFVVRGMQFHSGYNQVNCDVGKIFLLEREPHNPYDSNAVRVYDEQTQQTIGHIEKEGARLLAPVMDSEEHQFQFIAAVSGPSNSYELPIRIAISTTNTTVQASASPSLKDLVPMFKFLKEHLRYKFQANVPKTPRQQPVKATMAVTQSPAAAAARMAAAASAQKATTHLKEMSNGSSMEDKVKLMETEMENIATLLMEQKFGGTLAGFNLCLANKKPRLDGSAASVVSKQEAPSALSKWVARFCQQGGEGMVSTPGADRLWSPQSRRR